VTTALVDKTAFAILDHLARGQGAGFSDVQLVVPNPRTLSSRLKVLESEGLVAREAGQHKRLASDI
jgi:DNA-binding HxlR family transcriptional regulator